MKALYTICLAVALTALLAACARPHPRPHSPIHVRGA